MDYLRSLSLDEACKIECILVVDKSDVNVFIQNTKSIISRMKTAVVGRSNGNIKNAFSSASELAIQRWNRTGFAIRFIPRSNFFIVADIDQYCSTNNINEMPKITELRWNGKNLDIYIYKRKYFDGIYELNNGEKVIYIDEKIYSEKDVEHNLANMALKDKNLISFVIKERIGDL